MKTFKQWLETMVVAPVKAGADYQVAGTGSAGMKKKMSGFGNPGGIAVPKETK
jgi:hypothetical protein